MSIVDKLRNIFDRAIQNCLDKNGLDGLKKTSLFGSNKE